MKSIKLISAFMMIFCMVFGILSVGSAAAYTLSLEARNSNSELETQFEQEDILILHILLNDPTGVAGCAFTLNYPTDVLIAPETTVDGTSGDITSSFPFTYNSTDTHRENSSEPGKIYFSGAAINTTTGGAIYNSADDIVLFTVRFIVKSDATLGNFNLSLTQTELFNPDAGWYDDANTNGVYDDDGTEDTPEPVSVLVGAVDDLHADWDNPGLAFPVLLGDDTYPFTTVTYVCEIVPPPAAYSISGTVSYTGSQTGTIYVGAFDGPDPNAANKISCTPIDQPGAYTIENLPNGTYYIGSYRDSDGEATSEVMDRDLTEAQGMYTDPGNPTPVPVSGVNVTGKDFTIYDPDSEPDGIPDYWEINHFGNTTTATATSDYDSDGLTDLEEYGSDTDPKDTDTDNDGYIDGNDANPLTADAPGGIGYDPVTDTRTYDISGFISYSGSQTGTLYVKVYDDAAMTSEIASTSFESPTFAQPYDFTGLAAKANYYLMAFIDVAGGTIADLDENEAMGSIGPIAIAADMLDKDIALTDPAPKMLIDVDPSTSGIQSERYIVLGQILDFDIAVQNVTNLKSFSLQINYDDSKLQAVNTGIVEGPFITQDGANTTFFMKDTSTSGVIGLDDAISPAGTPVYPTGEGVVASVRFEVIGGSMGDDIPLTITMPKVFNSLDVETTPQAMNATLHFGIPGDFSSSTVGVPDGYVDIYDLIFFANHWHLTENDQNWSPICDVDTRTNVDGLKSIDIYDLISFANAWHTGTPPSS